MASLKVNKQLLPMKAHYFLWNAGTAPVTPFLSVYAKQLGFSSFIVGIIYMVLPICGMLAKPLMGFTADKFRCQKKIFLAFILFTAVMFVSILYIPTIKPNGKASFDCGDSQSDLKVDTTTLDRNFVVNQLANPPNLTANCKLKCSFDDNMWHTVKSYWHFDNQTFDHNVYFTAHLILDLTVSFDNEMIFFKVANVTMPNGRTMRPICPDRENVISSFCDTTCDTDYVNDLLPKGEIHDDDIVHYYQFWLFVLFMILAWVGQAVVVSVSDTICFELLGNQPNKYGNQRCFGSLGWGSCAIIVGFLVDATSERKDIKNYTYAFYLGFVLLILDFFVSLRLKPEQKSTDVHILRDVGQLFKDVRVCVFMLWCIFIGICTGLIWNFLFWFIESLEGADPTWIKTLEGFAMAIQCLGGELPLFFLSGWIVRKMGHVNCMTFILLAMGVRFLLYSILSNPWYILPIEFFNGITFGLFYACMASYASSIAPPGAETTMQGVVGAIFEGIGASTGSLLGGYMFGKYSGSITYRIFGIVSLILTAIHFGVQFVLKRTFKDLGTYRPPSDCFDYVDEEQFQELKLVPSS